MLKRGGNAIDAAVARGLRAGGGVPGGRQPRRRRLHDRAAGRRPQDLPRLPREGAAGGHGQHVPRQGRQRHQGPEHQRPPRRRRAGHRLGHGIRAREVRHHEARRRSSPRRSRWPTRASCWSRATSTCWRPPPPISRRTRSRRDLPEQGRALRGRPEAGAEGPGQDAAAISREGPDGFYKGRVGSAIVASSQAGKGIITQADLDQYKTRELAPVECDYRGYRVVSAPPPSSGGVIICEMLNILEGYPLKDLGFRSAQARALPDRGHAPRLRRPQQLPGRPGLREEPARPPARQGLCREDPRASSIRRRPASPRTSSRASRRTKAATPRTIRSLDQWGNAVSVTYTLNDWFGAKVTAAKHRRAAQQRDGRLHLQGRACPTCTAWCRARPTPSPRASAR